MQFIFLVVLLHACISHGSRLAEQKQQEFDAIEKYELIHLNLDGLETNNIIELDAYGQHYTVQLIRNDQISPNINHQTENELIKRQPLSQSCHYHGKVLNYEGKSVVALSLCDKYGVRGMIRAFGDELWINPADYYLDIENTRKTFKFTDQHLVYKLSDYKMSEKELALGTNFLSMKQTMDKTHEHAQSSTRRRLASFNSGDNVVELYTLADKSFVDYFKESTEDWYSLLYYSLSTIINGASAEYEATQWDSVVSSGGKEIGKVSIAWVELDVVETWGTQKFAGLECNPCTYGGYTGSSAYMFTFSEWCQANKDISNFDYGVIYTADSYYGGGGYSHVGGMCQDSKKYGYVGETSISRGNWLLLAHELGHDLGMQHDEKSGQDYYTCADGGIMYGPQVQDNGFTTCSLQYLRDYFNLNGVTCLARRSHTATFTSNYDQTPVDPWSCVLISGASKNSQHNGEWTQGGVDGNDNRWYTKDGYYLYYAYDGGDYWMWSISQTLGEWGWSNVVCNWTPASIYTDCDGKWNNDDTAKFGYCPVQNTSPTAPTTRVTPSPTPGPTTAAPVSAPAGGDCITVSGFTQSGYTKYNGQWFEGSSDYNGWPYYVLDSTYYLYMNGYVYNGNTYYFWVISEQLGLATWQNGWCNSNDKSIFECGSWSRDDNALFESCSSFTSLAESHPCLVDNPYDDNLCFYQNSSIESQEPCNFEVTTDISCINDYGVYRYITSNDDNTNTTYYLHRTASQWIISIDYITQYGAYFCDESDLLNCENGKWKYSVVDDDSARIISNDDVMISTCSTETAVESDDGSGSWIIAIILVSVALVVCGFCLFLFFTTRNKGKQSFQTNDNEVPQGVGVSMDSTAQQNEDVQEIEVEVPQTQTID